LGVAFTGWTWGGLDEVRQASTGLVRQNNLDPEVDLL